MATKIAAHAADIAKKVPHARDMDDKMGQARRKLDWDAMWKCALDPVTGKKRYEESPAATEGTCTMCGKMCAVRTVNKVFEGTTIDLAWRLALSPRPLLAASWCLPIVDV